MKLLVKFEKNYADEFDVYGFKIFDKEEWDILFEEIKNSDKKTSYNCSFGTNEGWEDEPISDFVHDFETKELEDKEAFRCIEIFGVEYGWFPDLRYELQYDENDENTW